MAEFVYQMYEPSYEEAGGSSRFTRSSMQLDAAFDDLRNHVLHTLSDPEAVVSYRERARGSARATLAIQTADSETTVKAALETACQRFGLRGAKV